jgi:hypothetical protein
MSAVEWRGAAKRVAVVATVAALIFMVAAVIVVGSRASSSGSGAGAFNTCIEKTRFLVFTRHESGTGLVETIKVRADHEVVGQFGAFRSIHAAVSFASTLPVSGAGSMNGRMVLLTKSPIGRAAHAIDACEGPEFPASTT